MKNVKAHVRKLLSALENCCKGISYVWFLIPVPYYIGLEGAWKNMQTSPEVTDSYFEVMMWMMALLVVALVGLFHRRRHIQFCLAAFVGFVMFLAMETLSALLCNRPRRALQQTIRYLPDWRTTSLWGRGKTWQRPFLRRTRPLSCKCGMDMKAASTSIPSSIPVFPRASFGCNAMR